MNLVTCSILSFWIAKEPSLLFGEVIKSREHPGFEWFWCRWSPSFFFGYVKDKDYGEIGRNMIYSLVNSLPISVSQWYIGPRIKLRLLVRILPSKHISQSEGTSMFLYGCSNMLRKFSVQAEFFQCRKYKWSMLNSSSINVILLYLCLHCVES